MHITIVDKVTVYFKYKVTYVYDQSSSYVNQFVFLKVLRYLLEQLTGRITSKISLVCKAILF